MQAANLDDVAAELYLSHRTAGTEWVKLLTLHWVKHPTCAPTIYSPDPAPLQIQKLTRAMGNIPSNLERFLVITMV